MEEEKSKAAGKKKKHSAQRKNAIIMPGPIDLSSLSVPPEESGPRRASNLKRTKSDSRPRPNINISGQGAIPKIRPNTEKIQRKFKSTSSKPDFDAHVTDREASQNHPVRRSISEATPLTRGDNEIIVEVEIVKKVNRSDKDIHIYKEVDVRKLRRLPQEESDSDQIIDETIVRKSRSEVVNPISGHLKSLSREQAKRSTNITHIKSNSEAFINEVMHDMYKRADLEQLSFHGLFDSELNLFDDEIHRSNSFNVMPDFNTDKESSWFSNPRCRRTFSNESIANELEDEKFEEVFSTRKIIVKQRRKNSQRPLSERLRRKSRTEKLKQESGIPGYSRMRRKSKSEELFQGINEKFMQTLQLGSNKDYYYDDGNYSSSEDLLSNHPKRNQRNRELFSQGSMNSIEENFETPPMSPLPKEVFTFPDKPKTEKKRKVSTGRKIIDKIKNEIVRKISCGEKNPGKIKREKSIEKLRKKYEIDRNFQKWIDHVICIHVSKTNLAFLFLLVSNQ